MMTTVSEAERRYRESLQQARKALTDHCATCLVKAADEALDTLLRQAGSALDAPALPAPVPVAPTVTPTPMAVHPRQESAPPKAAPVSRESAGAKRDAAVLSALKAVPAGLSAAKLIDRLGWTKPTTYAALRRLVVRGFVIRSDDCVFRLKVKPAAPASPATPPTPAISTLVTVWSGRKDDPSLSSVGARKPAPPGGL